MRVGELGGLPAQRRRRGLWWTWSPRIVPLGLVGLYARQREEVRFLDHRDGWRRRTSSYSVRASPAVLCECGCVGVWVPGVWNA